LPTREQVLATVGGSRDYVRASEQLGIPAGQAYLIATGVPADGGDTFPPEDQRRAGMVEGSTQSLVYRDVEVVNPINGPKVHAWIRRRAAQDPALVAAGRARDAEPGQPEDVEDTDVAHVLTRQHDRVTALMEQMKALPGVTKGGSALHQARRQAIADIVNVEISKHETAEQEHFWPAVRQVLSDGDSLAEAALAQEREGRDHLAALGHASPSDEQFDELAEQLDKDLRKHVAYEDRVVLALGRVTSEQDRQDCAACHAPGRGQPGRRTQAGRPSSRTWIPGTPPRRRPDSS
jgi:Hemerythrin HHE cation binding domain